MSHPQGSTRLCERCRTLDLESYLDRRSSNYLEVKITKGSVQDYCSLCGQLQAFFNQSTNGKLDAQEHDEFHIVYYGDSSMPYTYLAVYTDSVPPLLLIPARTEECSRTALADVACSPGRVILGDCPDFALAQEWLRYCREDHGTSCGQSPARSATNLKVIDCRTRVLCTISAGTPFAALSYVWGDTISDVQAVHEKLPDELPKTVENCIFAALALDIRYLWIDRYSIDQNNAEEKHGIIRNMDRIYSSAELTIIAATGKDSHYGLPGVQNTRRRAQMSISLGKHRLVSLEPVTPQIQESKWHSRAWTYQETLLSRRRLIFTESQMYFQCTEMHCLEGVYLDALASSPLIEWKEFYPAFPEGGTRWSIEDLNMRLNEYYSRQLSYSEDVLNAFEGVFSAFRESTTTSTPASHFWGIPLLVGGNREHVSFAAGLSWYVLGAFSYGRFKADSNKIFPSWSWAYSKANNKPGNSCGDLHMENWWQDDIFGLSEDLSVHVTHISGTRMDIATFALQSDDYTNFSKKIDITNWTMTGCTSYTRPVDFLTFLGVLGGDYRSDYYGYFNQEDWEGKELLAIYLMASPAGKYLFPDSLPTMHFLWVEKVEPGIYRRVGVWRASVKVNHEDPVSQVKWYLDQILSDGGIKDKKWELRTITIT